MQTQTLNLSAQHVATVAACIQLDAAAIDAAELALIEQLQAGCKFDEFADPFEDDATPADLAAIDAYNRAEMRAAQKDAADVRAGIRENIINEFETIDNYWHTVGSAGGEREIARVFNVSENFAEDKNRRRRETRAADSFKAKQDAAKVGAMKVNRAAETVAPKPAKPVFRFNHAAGQLEPVKVHDCPPVAAPVEIPAVNFAAGEAAKWAGYYVDNLCHLNPNKAAKLQKSLAWQLAELATCENPDKWQKRAKLAFDAKVR